MAVEVFGGYHLDGKKMRITCQKLLKTKAQACNLL